MKKEIKTELGTYTLALITSDFIFYVNEHEGDENGCTIMYDRHNKLISDNYFAFDEYINTMDQIITNQLKCEYVNQDRIEDAKFYLGLLN